MTDKIVDTELARINAQPVVSEYEQLVRQQIEQWAVNQDCLIAADWQDVVVAYWKQKGIENEA